MGIRMIIGHTYKCNNCGTLLKKEKDISTLLFPINFDYKIKKCPACEKKYIDENCMEYFYATKKSFNILFCISSFIWITLIEFIGTLIISTVFDNSDMLKYFALGFPIVFIPIYYFLFNKKWKNEINNSNKRVNNSEYLIDLILANILNIELVETLYIDKLISKNNYDKVKSHFDNK